MLRNAIITTVCWDTNTLVTDSKGSLNGTAMIAGVRKLFTPTEDDYWEIMGVKVLAFGFAGDYDLVPWVKEALQNNFTHRTRLDNMAEGNFTAIAITEKKEVWYFGMSRSPKHGTNVHILSPVSGPYATGSGGAVATAVLSIGRTAKEAVKQAIRLDNHSGGDLQIWEFPGVPDVLSKRPIEPDDQLLFSKAEVREIIDEAISKVNKRLEPPTTTEKVEQ